MLLFTDPLFLEHNTGSHPENAGRLAAIHKKLAETGLIDRCQRGVVSPAPHAAIAAVHGDQYLKRVEQICERGGGSLDADTRVSARSFEVARHAAGAACTAVEQVVRGDDTRALCLIRPPGHHALPDRAMGFCLLNNIAIAARHAQLACGLKRVLIVDWDVHHGNGTQDIFYADGSVGFYSIHRFPFYPGTGDWDETGTGAGAGTTWNVPIAYGTSREKYFERFQRTLDDAVATMRPELILISAGFDAHRLDPIGSLDLETEDFARLTELVVAAANAECQGKIVSLLEGGYHPQALADSVAVHLTTLAGDQ
ncbi:histone deacetylase family protein [Planctomicrobium piriforme]|uniref:histone deacetylase n=1 Tax=Planctomicrobium piriforme TaxID=1576369 RepID=A0A1I3Q8F8_9PLAN|nr:histone deacetylase [Planctomicrobium piriforme]SFJ30534.1 Acetoin utilization deacetylase AcuC [Planctomicrobium piriforme]